MFTRLICTTALLLPLVASASDPLREEIRSLGSSRYRADSARLLEVSGKAKGLLREILVKEGAGSESLRIRGGANGYDALRILPKQGNGPISNFVREWSAKLNDLPFVYAPEILFQGSTSAFFDSQGAYLGVAQDFVTDSDRVSSGTIHEIYHADTFRQVIDGTEELYAGLYQVEGLRFLSAVDQNYYGRFASLDEIVATSLSLKLDAERLARERATLGADAKEDLLGEIHHSVLVVKSLARQLTDTMKRIRPEQAKVERQTLRLGVKSREIEVAKFSLDSFSREVVGPGRLDWIAHPNGASFRFYFAGQATPAAIAKRAQDYAEAIANAESLAKQVEGCIRVVIEYVRVDGTDLDCVIEKAPKAYEHFESRKRERFAY